MRRMVWLWAAVAGVGLAAGCGGAKSEGFGGTGKDALEDFGAMLKSLAQEGRKPPANLAGLEPVEPMTPVGGPALRNGEIVYLWGAGYEPGGTKVVAYTKKTDTEGGWVLLQDGTIKQMTAAEFSSAPRAGP
jgi:hypothetical protein